MSAEQLDADRPSPRHGGQANQGEIRMHEEISLPRRRFVGAAMTLAAGQLVLAGAANAQSGNSASATPIKPGTNTSFAPLKQITAGVLDIGYAEAGPADGPPV